MTAFHSPIWQKLVLVGAGGAAGAISRYCFYWLAHRNGVSLPLTTVLINLLGSAAAGAIVGILLARPQLFSPEIQFVLSMGFLGGFTTFSTFSVESLQLLQSDAPLRGFAYLVLSPLLGLVFAGLGLALGRSL